MLAKPVRKPDADDLDLGQAPPAPRSPAAAHRKLATAKASSAGRAVPSVAEARRLHEVEQAGGNQEARVMFERGRTAEEGGKPGVAAVYYRMAVKRATGSLREQIQERLDAVNSPGTP